MHVFRRIRTAALAFCTALVAFGCDDPAKVQQPPPCFNCFTTQDALVEGLSRAYQERNFDKFTALFPTAIDAVNYLFFLDPSSNPPVPNWDLTEELRIHRRMFIPQDPLPGETPVPTDYWLSSISINLSQTSVEWTERPDLYATVANPAGLDAVKWKATEAEYRADVFFDLQGPTDYRVDGRAAFVVIEDRMKASGSERKFLLYRWEDLGAASAVQQASKEPKSWGAIKAIYS